MAAVTVISLPSAANAATGTVTTNVLLYVGPQLPGSTSPFQASITWNGNDSSVVPSGTITYYLDGVSVGSTDVLTHVSPALAPLTGGTHIATATYSGDSVYASSTASETFTAKFQSPAFPGDFGCYPGGAIPAPGESCWPTYDEGTPVSFAASLGYGWSPTSGRPEPTGVIHFTENGHFLMDIPLVNGAATYVTSSLSPGTHSITFSWDGDNNYYPPNAQSHTVFIKASSTPVTPSQTNPATQPTLSGYREIGNDGSVWEFGTIPLGPLGSDKLHQPIVGAASLPDNVGYWMVDRDGAVFPFGGATFYGFPGGIKLNQPIVGMASTASGKGYWLVASDGGIFAYGDAKFYGSTGNIKLNKPIVGMARTANGNGYWLVASDGGIFSFGDASFHGSTGSMHLNKPVVGMTPTISGNGYWLVASDGGIFAFGDATFHGSTGSIALNQPITGMMSTATGQGYIMIAADGGIFCFGDAVFKGSAASSPKHETVVAITPMR
jgi:hypothetical protein